MTEEAELMAAAPDAEEQTDTVRGAFARLYADGRAYAGAEIERQKLKAGIAGASVRDAVIFGVAGLMIVFAGLVSLLVGLVLVLTPLLGPGLATAIVFGSSVLIAAGLLLIAKGRLGKMKKAIQS